MKIIPVVSLEVDDCNSIKVTGRSRTTRGVYLKSQEYAESTPENPVWKHQKNDRYIFNTGSSDGWKIGKTDHLSNSKFYFSSGTSTFPYDSQKWTNKKGRHVEVKCRVII